MTAMSAISTARRRRELAGDSRAGSFARVKAHNAQRTYIREHWKFLTAGWMILALPVLAVAWFLPTDLLQGMAVGAALTGASAMVWFWVVQSTGTAPTMMGDQAEQWTAQTLRRLGSGWRLVNRFLLSDDGDIDHVVIGPAGVFVVETKWSASAWEASFNRATVRRAVQRVDRSARNLRNSMVKRTGMPVRAVVVLWGGGTRDWPPHRRLTHVGEVAVVAGPHLKEFMRTGRDDLYPPSTVDAVWRALEAHARKRDEREGGLRVPVSATSVLIRIGLFIAALCSAAIAMSELFRWSDSALATSVVGVVTSATLFAANRRWSSVRAVALGAFAGVAALTLLIGLATLISLA